MPGDSVRDWDMYHALRRHGFPKSSAAAISNAHYNRTRKKKKQGKKEAPPWWSPSQVYRGVKIRAPGEEDE